MTETSETFRLTPYEDTTKSTYSPASADGPSPSNSQDGPDQSGPGLARVNRFQLQARRAQKTMNAMSGRSSAASRQSARLQLSLVNKLLARMDVNGSTLYSLTWKSWDMPARAPICALRASGRHISDSAYGGWPTPCSQDGPKGGPNQGTDRLPGAASLAGWPTPTKANADGSQAAKDASTTGRRPDGSTATVHLNAVARSVIAGWPTPVAHDDNKSVAAHMERKARTNSGPMISSLQVIVKTIEGWATPLSRDWKDSPGMATESVNPDGSVRKRPDTLARQAHQTLLQLGGERTCPVFRRKNAAGWIRSFPAGSWGIPTRGQAACLRQRNCPAGRGALHPNSQRLHRTLLKETNNG